MTELEDIATCFASVQNQRCFAFSPSGAMVASLTERVNEPVIAVRSLEPQVSYSADFPLSNFGRQTQLLLTEKEVILLQPILGTTGWTLMHGLILNPQGLKVIAHLESDSARLIRGPIASGWHLISTNEQDREQTVLWMYTTATSKLTRIMQVQGFLSGGVWLDSRDTLFVNLSSNGSPADGYILSLKHQTCERIFHISDNSNDRIELFEARTSLLVVSSDIYGAVRLGVSSLREKTPVRFMPFSTETHQQGNQTVCLTYNEGHQLLLHETRGVRSELLSVNTSTLKSRALPIPDGVVGFPVVRQEASFRFPFVSPSYPSTCVEFDLRTQLCKALEPQQLNDVVSDHLATYEIMEVPTKDGQIEVILHHAKRSKATVIALHGGPVAQWSYEFAPLFHFLSSLGVTVVAPNVTGSTGYGNTFIQAIRGKWGVVDMADVIDLRSYLISRRIIVPSTPLMLLGESYGAFLALRIGARYPQWFSSVTALSPFVSLPELYKCSSERMRNALRVLAGPQIAADDDSLEIASQLAHAGTKLMLLHGDEDTKIPVKQVRNFKEHLLQYGKQEGVDLFYQELPGVGHDLDSFHARQVVFSAVGQFFHHVTS